MTFYDVIICFIAHNLSRMFV